MMFRNYEIEKLGNLNCLNINAMRISNFVIS